VTKRSPHSSPPSKTKWRWVYGAIAVYGLRPHEALFFRINPDGTANVPQAKPAPARFGPISPNGSTNSVAVKQRLPGVTTENRPYEQIGRNVIKVPPHPRVKCPWKIYNLRHAWAVRTMALGMKDHLAAKEMGHSVEVHQRIYQAWIDDTRTRRRIPRNLKIAPHGDDDFPCDRIAVFTAGKGFESPWLHLEVAKLSTTHRQIVKGDSNRSRP
jgi:hypothetical protein